jgi:hypothetical protein
MKLEVNITKKRFFVILVAILIVGGVLLVIAYNSPMYKTSPDAGASYKTSVQAITFGHSADEMVVKMTDGSLKTVQELLANGVGSSGGGNTPQTTLYNYSELETAPSFIELGVSES